jgi:hypothetical protein
VARRRVTRYVTDAEVHLPSLRSSSPSHGTNARNVRNADEVTTTAHRNKPGTPRWGQKTASATAYSGTLVQKAIVMR